MSRVPAIAVVDTHALIWWLGDARRRLGRRANAFLDRVDRGDAVACIPTVVLAELSEAIQAGHVRLGESFAAFAERLESTPSRYVLAPLTSAVVARAHELYAIPERTDRLIAATAAHLGYPLVTRDPEIAAAFDGERVW